MRRVVIFAVLIFILAYLLICLFMWSQQRSLMYFPTHDIQKPAAYGLHGFEDLRLTSSDGVRLQAWYHPARAGYPLIVYFHGNGGHLGYRAHYYQLLTNAGFGLLALSYRGYGASEGSPSEEGFYTDGRAIMDYAMHTLSVPPDRIILYGESIGTGTAVQMATEYKAGALVLQSPFTSALARAKAIYWWLPVGLLMKDRYDSLSKIARVYAPLLVFHGEKDLIIPVKYGKELFAAAPEPKKAIYFPKAGHEDFDLSLLAVSLVIFCQERGLIQQ